MVLGRLPFFRVSRCGENFASRGGLRVFAAALPAQPHHSLRAIHWHGPDCGTRWVRQEFSHWIDLGSPILVAFKMLPIQRSSKTSKMFREVYRSIVWSRLKSTCPGLRHPEIRGMVLQSPMESCGRVVFGSAASWLGYRTKLTA